MPAFHLPFIPSAQLQSPSSCSPASHKELSCPSGSPVHPQCLAMLHPAALLAGRGHAPLPASPQTLTTLQQPRAPHTPSLLIVPTSDGETCSSLGVHFLGCWREAAGLLTSGLTLLSPMKSLCPQNHFFLFFSPLLLPFHPTPSLTLLE